MSGGVREYPQSSLNYEDGNYVEIVNSDFSQSHCKEMYLDFPPRHRAFGGQIGEMNIICGGKYNSTTIYDTCFSISNSGEVNKNFSTMQIARYGAASAIWNNNLYISGGKAPLVSKSTEIIVQNNQTNFNETKDLTQPLYGHCAVLLSTEEIMIIGGANLRG